MYDHIVTDSPLLPSGVTLTDIYKDANEQELAKVAPFIKWELESGTEPSAVSRQQQGSATVDAAVVDISAEPSSFDATQQLLAKQVAVCELHAALRDCCDMMGIGLGLPRNDTVVEVSGREIAPTS